MMQTTIIWSLALVGVAGFVIGQLVYSSAMNRVRRHHGRFRSKHAVEAMRWTDTDENRQLFAEWFDTHDVMFETRGDRVCLPDFDNEVAPGEWIVRLPGDFIAMGDVAFHEAYELAP